MTDDVTATTEESQFSPAPPSSDSPPTAPSPPNGSIPGQTADDAGGDGRRRGINRTVIEWGLLLVAAIVLALVIKTFLFQAFYIPSESMVPTLEVGDRVLVNKLSYDLHDVHRGDIVVFEAQPNPGWRDTGITDLVKRVIALPGETVTECGQTADLSGKVCINGRELREGYLPSGTTTTFPITPSRSGCAADSPEHGCTVLPGHYFVMGDNRARSADARLHGPIKGPSIVGRVFVRIWPLDRLGFL